MKHRATGHSLLRALAPCAVQAVGSGVGFGLVVLVALGFSAGPGRAALVPGGGEVNAGRPVPGVIDGVPPRPPRARASGS